MSSQDQPQVTPQPVPYPYQQPRPQGRSPQMIFAMLAIIAIIVLVPFLAVVAIMGNTGSSSPAAAYTGYVNGINSGDVKLALDHTTFRFAPNHDQQAMMMQSQLLNFDPHITIVSMTTIRNASMSMDQRAEAMDRMNSMRSSLNIKITDYAYVDYTMTLAYGVGGASSTFHSEVLCVKVNGSWYVALTSYL